MIYIIMYKIYKYLLKCKYVLMGIIKNGRIFYKMHIPNIKPQLVDTLSSYKLCFKIHLNLTCEVWYLNEWTVYIYLGKWYSMCKIYIFLAWQNEKGDMISLKK